MDVGKAMMWAFREQKMRDGARYAMLREMLRG